MKHKFIIKAHSLVMTKFFKSLDELLINWLWDINHSKICAEVHHPWNTNSIKKPKMKEWLQTTHTIFDPGFFPSLPTFFMKDNSLIVLHLNQCIIFRWHITIKDKIIMCMHKNQGWLKPLEVWFLLNCHLLHSDQHLLTSLFYNLFVKVCLSGSLDIITV